MKNSTKQILILSFLCICSTLWAVDPTIKLNTNLGIEPDGTIVATGEATTWDDLTVYPEATSRGGSNSPTAAKFKDNGAGSQGVFLWWFSSGSEQEVYFQVQMPHSYKVGTTLYPHVHWTTASTTPTTTNVVWRLEYTIMSFGGNFGNTTTTTTSTVVGETVPSGVGQHLISSLGTISGTGIGISTFIICRLYRQVTDPADVFPDAAGLLGFDIHYERDMQGSRTAFEK